MKPAAWYIRWKSTFRALEDVPLKQGLKLAIDDEIYIAVVALEDVPLKQGLKHGIEFRLGVGYTRALEDVPLKQGLKPDHPEEVLRSGNYCFRGCSIKTRIETSVSGTSRYSDIRALEDVPLKQGLKHHSTWSSGNSSRRL